MIPVVGCPAKGELREIPRSDDDAALLVCDVHEDLRPLSCLAVLIGDIVVVHVLADVLKVLCHRRGDADLLQSKPQRLCKRQGIPVRAVRRSKARHRDGKNPRPVKG